MIMLPILGGFDMTTVSCHRATPQEKLSEVCR